MFGSFVNVEPDILHVKTDVKDIDLKDYYSKGCAWRQVREAFEEVVQAGWQPSLPVWNALLTALAATGSWREALGVLQQVISLTTITPSHMKIPLRVPHVHNEHIDWTDNSQIVGSWKHNF